MSVQVQMAARALGIALAPVAIARQIADGDNVPAFDFRVLAAFPL